ncbi:protein kinase domain-containing protein [Dactylosporangium sp. CA-233914]|uniref:protein kinase domain-containing protein n=1 Tax=Dactylosporangium sp. CA-233914 TaxID=3239934 RepID=UPI003D8CDEDB
MTKDEEVIAGRYALVRELGKGSMGRVWLARDEILHRDVALKELAVQPDLAESERDDAGERAMREARAIAKLNHPNVVRVFDVLRHRRRPWIVMELVPSRSLHQVVVDDGPLPPRRVARIGLAVLAGLVAVHEAGILHRDVKPGNVLLADDGRVMLTDFGLAISAGDPIVTRTGIVVGSPAYLAPERTVDGPIGPPSDLWSLGATLYAAVEGKSPFERSSTMSTLAALATEPVPPPKRAGPLWSVVEGLLRKDPRDRIDAATAERLLSQVADPEVPDPPGPAPLERAPRTPGRKRLLVGAVTGGALVATVVTALAMAQPHGTAVTGSAPDVPANAEPSESEDPAPAASRSAPVSATAGSTGSVRPFRSSTSSPTTTPTPTPGPSGQATPPPAGVNLSRLLTSTNESSEQSDPNAAYTAGFAFDGNASTRWASRPEAQSWLQAVWAQEHTVTGFRIVWHTACSRSYDVTVSLDGATWRTVYSQRNGDGGTDEIRIAAAPARYVRLNSLARCDTSTGVSVTEFDILGT